MTYVAADVKINDVALAEIDPSEVSSNAIDAAGEIDIDVSFTDGTTVYQCAACGASTNAEGVHKDDTSGCPQNENYGQSHVCGEDCDTPTDEDGEGGCELNGEDKPAPHVATVAPLGWVNSASLATDASQDEVRFSISIDDPRGAFVITFARVESEDETGRKFTEYRMSVPHPTDSFLHMPLTPLNNTGYYRAGERSYHD